MRQEVDDKQVRQQNSNKAQKDNALSVAVHGIEEMRQEVDDKQVRQQNSNKAQKDNALSVAVHGIEEMRQEVDDKQAKKHNNKMLRKITHSWLWSKASKRLKVSDRRCRSHTGRRDNNKHNRTRKHGFLLVVVQGMKALEDVGYEMPLTDRKKRQQASSTRTSKQQEKNNFLMVVVQGIEALEDVGYEMSLTDRKRRQQAQSNKQTRQT
jgi:hypothetical protein